MTKPFGSQCETVISNNYDTVGTVTRATLARLKPSDVKALFTDGTKWNEMASMLRTQFEMQACGVKRNGMYDWLMSSQRPGMGKLIQAVKRDKGPSLIQPFILGRQNSIVNPDYFVLTSGCPKSGYTTHASTVASTPGTSMTGPLDVSSGYSGSDRIVRVIAGYGLPLDSKLFNPGTVVYILNRSTGGTAQHGAWKVVSATVAADSSFIDVGLVTLNAFDTSLADTTPYTGMLIAGLNNVHDVEKWCYNPVNQNNIKYVPFWYQTTRRVRSVDSEYRAVFKKLMEDNDWFAAFQDLPLAERNRQDEAEYQRRVVHTMFFGRPISQYQVLEGSSNWTSLDAIQTFGSGTVDPGTGGITVAYRANLVGFYEQFKACSRVFDYQNGALNIATFLESKIFDIVRARESQGRDATSIDIYTDSTSADEFLVAFIAYAKDKLSDIVRINVEEGKNDELGFSWRSFRCFKPQGVVVNIIVHRFFDDLLNTLDTLSTGSQASRGRVLAVLDLGKGGSMYPAVLASNRKNYRSGEIEELAKVDTSYACVMENPTIDRSLTSETLTAIVEAPLNSGWYENFSQINFSA